MPPSDSGKSTIMVMQFGTCLGLIPALGLDLINIEDRILGVNRVPAELLRIYHSAMLRRLYPDDPRVQAEQRRPETGLSKIQGV